MSNYINEAAIPWWDIRNNSFKNKKNVEKTKSWSSYWMDQDSYDYFYEEGEDTVNVGIGTYHKNRWNSGKTAKVDIVRSHKLASIRRAVSNFVRILTNDDSIKVVFSSGERSFTPGEKYVVISAEEDPDKFDVLVGTALHEAAHCVFSQNLFTTLNEQGTYPYTPLDFLMFAGVDETLIPTGHYDHKEKLETIINFIEDRRIDTEVFHRSVGYRPYYQAMYNTVWNAKTIAHSLIFDPRLNIPEYRSYDYRLVNLTNPATKYTLGRLPYLREIYDIVDMDNILRYSMPDGNCHDLNVIIDAGKIYNLILRGIAEAPAKNTDDSNQPKPAPTACKMPNDKSEDLPNLDSMLNSPVETEDSSDDTSEETDDNSDSKIENTKEESKDETKNEMSKEDISEAVSEELGEKNLGRKNDDVDKSLDKIRKEINGESKKKKITKKEDDAITTMEKSDTKISYITFNGLKYPYIRIGKLNEGIVTSMPPTFFAQGWYRNRKKKDFVHTDDDVVIGKRMGQIIVDRIKIRHDKNETKFTRRDAGKIDRRLIFSLGYENENVFFNRTTEEYKDSIIYLTIDGSSSMNADKKWDRSVQLATGLAYAATKINNFDIVVNLRYDSRDTLWSITLFDSRVDTFSHFERWMPRFKSSSSTPESLIYQVEQKFIESLKTPDNNVYFITITDGEPLFTLRYKNKHGWKSDAHFDGETASHHCRGMMNAFREKNINIMAFYINHDITDVRHTFKQSYGADGEVIDTTNFSVVSNSINKLLTKSYTY